MYHRAAGRAHIFLEALEDRLVLDAGDTLATAMATGIGPAPGNFRMYIELLGDGAQGNRDVDLYRFQAGAGSILTARTSPGVEPVPMDPIVRLFDSVGTEITINDDYATSRYGRVDHVFTTAGTYYVGISGSPNAAYDPTAEGSGVPADELGYYGLELNLSAAPAVAADVGDYLWQATWTGVYGFYDVHGYYSNTLRLGDGANGGADVDLFQVYASPGTVLTMRTTAPYAGSAAVDTYLRLFDGSGIEVASNDDGSPEYGLFSLLTFTVSVEGYYYVGVSGYPNTGYDPAVPGTAVNGETGLYRLEVMLTEAPQAPAADVGDSVNDPTWLTSAGYVQIDQRIGDGAQTTRDVDFYVLFATAGQTLLALTSRPPNGAAVDTALRLFDGDAFEISMNDDGAPGYYSFLSYRFQTTGVYYLAVSAYPNYAYGPYGPGTGVVGGTGAYTLSFYLYNGGTGPGTGPGSGNGSDVVFGLLAEEAIEIIQPETQPLASQQATEIQPEQGTVATSYLPALLPRRERPESPGLLLLLDQVIGELLEN